MSGLKKESDKRLTKKRIFKALAVVTFFPTIFGFIVARSGYIGYSVIDELIPLKVKVDSITSSTTGGGKSHVSAHFSNNGDYHIVCISCYEARAGYYMKDSIEVWLKPGRETAYLKHINPNKEELRNRYYRQIFLVAGFMIYPFLIFLFLYIRQVHLDKKKLEVNSI
ncbi:hypothetical protein [Marivirga arenosa]|uniref:Uncharacterized protein n=1 Tax=Marivirga arenosa TaxID=3059076 RepID=A0AA49GHY6_9BACT|nr:hypothetical protein [Marivirga sp. BKB1-2]WKK78940.1 hypothetical protein QYS47_15500 [Marivirga sp. BKB1-2]